MFERISNSWELVKASYRVLRSDRELMLFPVMSTIGVIIVTIVFAVPLFASGLAEQLAEGTELTQGQEIMGIVLAFLFYFVMYTVIIFSNTALVGAAMIRLNGGDPTVSDGFRVASERIGAILGYAAISATVGVILSALRNDDNILARIVASFLTFAWAVVTFLVIPVLVVENVGPIEAIKRSGSLLRRTWGEQITGNFAMGMIFFLITLVALLLIGGPLLYVAFATDSGVAMIVAVGVIVLLVMAIILVGTALNGIFQAALYRYATEGEAGEFFEERLLAGAFHQK